MQTDLAALAQLRPDEARKTIEGACGVSNNLEQAAAILGVSLRTLHRLAKRVGASKTCGKLNPQPKP